jgi:hypothetical protein
MDLELQPTSSNSRSFLSRTLTRRSGGSDSSSSEETKGAFGLNTLYTPLCGSASVDLIFVHGLGGGSRSTWTKSSDPSLYWPKEWLPKDNAFQDVRIHSFGYDSNWKKGSILGLHDFANALLCSMLDSPVIPRDANVCMILPIVFSKLFHSCLKGLNCIIEFWVSTYLLRGRYLLKFRM